MAKKVRKGGKSVRLNTKLRVGDLVMVLSGGNTSKEGRFEGKTGKILRFSPKTNRVVVEGLSMVKRHKRAMTSQDSAGIIEKEGSIHLSNIMYFREDINRPVRIKQRELEDGRKVRGFIHPETKQFEQIDV